MENNAKPVRLKVFVDKEKNKVMFAEADKDFVEILFSFFTLPLGTIARLSSKHADSKNTKLGSLSSLYESLVNIDVKHFTNNMCKDALVNPINSSGLLCQKLKVILDGTKPTNASVNTSESDVVFVKKNASTFIVTDDLNVMPVLLDTSITLLKTLGVKYINLLDERSMYFGLEEFSNLLKWSMLTNNPLTKTVLRGSEPCLCKSCIINSRLNNLPSLCNNSSQPKPLKLLVQKSKNKVLCALAENYFVELLCSFLTIPLGTVKRLTKEGSSQVGINNLYKSISSLGEGKYLKSEDVRATLLNPKLAPNYLRVTDLLPIYEAKMRRGNFIKEQATFVVSDDLDVALSPSISTISKFNTLGVPVSDIEVLEVSIGEQEALLLLKASLTSRSVLTDCLHAFRKKPNAKPKFGCRWIWACHSTTAHILV